MQIISWYSKYWFNVSIYIGYKYYIEYTHEYHNNIQQKLYQINAEFLVYNFLLKFLGGDFTVFT